jgi:hypothetical protein
MQLVGWDTEATTVPRVLRPNCALLLGEMVRIVSVPVKKNISSAGLMDNSGPVGGEAVQKLYRSFYRR